MSRLCIEDGFEYQIERAISDYFDGYDTPDEAMSDFNEGDNDDFVNALYERASSYTNLTELAEKEKNARTGK
jgi:hypothetical protein